MLNGTAPDVEPALHALAERFANWRATRRHRSEPIPGVLWDEAVALCDALPISRVVQTLRLSGGELKKRCQARSATPPPDFIEVASPVTSSCSPATGVVIDLQRPDGAWLSIRTPDGTLALAELIDTFLAQR